MNKSTKTPPIPSLYCVSKHKDGKHILLHVHDVQSIDELIELLDIVNWLFGMGALAGLETLAKLQKGTGNAGKERKKLGGLSTQRAKPRTTDSRPGKRRGGRKTAR